MELTKKQWTIIAVIAGLVAIYFLFIRKTKMTVSESSFNEALPLIGENGYTGAQNRSGALNRNVSGN